MIYSLTSTRCISTFHLLAPSSILHLSLRNSLQIRTVTNRIIPRSSLFIGVFIPPTSAKTRAFQFHSSSIMAPSDAPEVPKAEYRQLGRSGLRVSVPILGAMSMGDKRWQKWVIEEDEVCAI